MLHYCWSSQVAQNRCLILIFITSVIGVPLLAQFLEPSRKQPGKLEILDAPNKVSVRETIVKLQVSRWSSGQSIKLLLAELRFKKCDVFAQCASNSSLWVFPKNKSAAWSPAGFSLKASWQKLTTSAGLCNCFTEKSHFTPQISEIVEDLVVCQHLKGSVVWRLLSVMLKCRVKHRCSVLMVVCVDVRLQRHKHSGSELLSLQGFFYPIKPFSSSS